MLLVVVADVLSVRPRDRGLRRSCSIAAVICVSQLPTVEGLLENEFAVKPTNSGVKRGKPIEIAKV